MTHCFSLLLITSVSMETWHCPNYPFIFIITVAPVCHSCFYKKVNIPSDCKPLRLNAAYTCELVPLDTTARELKRLDNSRNCSSDSHQPIARSCLLSNFVSRDQVEENINLNSLLAFFIVQYSNHKM